MCGIAGAINHTLNIQQLTKDLWHRGPDEQSTYVNSTLQLHHHRLAILDIACGMQPMHYEHLTIIFNGEIYNHQDLRKKYSLHCTTNSDTETLLHLYAKFGADFLNDLDGMFAIAIYDKKKHELFLARDRAGKKPLYYFFNGEIFLFSSELNAIRNQLPLQINEEHLQQYMRLGYFYKSATPYKNVWELPAGSYGLVSIIKPAVQITKWWDIHPFYETRSADDFDTALAKTDALLHEAIKRRVESSDLEVGSFLSGGIDSGLVTAIAKSYNNSLKTFTVSFEGEYDEAPLAKLVAERYGTVHHEIKISFDNLLDNVEQILYNYGEPFCDSSAIPSYYVSQAAKKHLTVILNGDGGDEIFGGYRRYVPFSKFDFFQPGQLVRNLSSLFHGVMPVSKDKRSKYNYFYRLVDLSQKKGLNTYLSATVDIFEGFEEFLSGNDSVLKEAIDHFSFINASPLTGLQKIMNLDFDNILPGDLLVKMDIATMAHSLEGRSPLLCKELLEYVPTLPDNYKIRGKQTKFLLRKLSEKYLPAELINQPKRGFEIPMKDWIDGLLNEMIKDYIMPANSYCRNYVESTFIEDLWNRKIKVSDEKRAKMIWTLFALEVWHRKVILRF